MDLLNIKENLYYPQHVHLAYGSIGDAILHERDYVRRGKEYGLDSLTITDHGSLSAMYSFARECRKEGIRPVIGMEAYECDDASLKDTEHKGYYHLILLARTNEGFRNLIHIHNLAQTDGFYFKPRADQKMLQEYGRGIIASSACVQGSIPQAILKGNLEEAKNRIEFYQDVFDQFYLEIQPGSFPEQIAVNDAIVQLSRETGVPILVTNDIHYLNKEDYIAHNLHVALKRKKQWKQGDPILYPDKCYWFMNYEQIKQAFTYTDTLTEEVVEEGLKNAQCIAHMCVADLPTKIYMPQYAGLKDGETEQQLLYKRCYEAMNKVSETLENPRIYQDRLERELKVISEKGFCGYFLVVQEYVKWARSNGIPVGPGRGSGAGSLVLYLLGITQADPIEHGLLFERFLDPCRAAIPDVDLDFSPERRDELFHHAVGIYGEDHCALVSTFGIRKAKSAIRDCARVLGYDKEVGDAIAKLIPDVYYGDGEKQTDLAIKDSLAVVPELQEYQKQYPELIDLAMKIEDLPKSTGLHAAGMLISPVSFTNSLPLIRSDKENVLATSMNLEDAEKQFVKFDYLSVALLSVIDQTQKDTGFVFDFRNRDIYKDAATWELIGSRNTTGCFQLGSKTYKERMPRLAPKTIDELAACLALVRGPCISNKMDEVYMQIIEGKQEVQKIHPAYDEVMKGTNGIMIFQEQIIKLIVAFGFDLPTGYTVMKFAQKKKADKLKAFRPQFIAQALAKDCDEETANRIFDMIVDAGLYSFNKAHAVSYATITYVSAYLKVHYPLQYMTNLLTNVFSRGVDKEYESTLNECRRLGFQFLPADINKSDWEFRVEDGNIRVGLCAVKGLGEKAVQHVMATRPYDSMADMQEKITKTYFNKGAMRNAVFSGVLDEFVQQEGFQDRESFYATYIDKNGIEELNVGKEKIPATDFTLARLEEAYYSVNFIHDPVNSLESFGWKDMRQHNRFDASVYIRKVKKIKTKRGQAMAFLTLGTGDGTIDCTVFPEQYDMYKKLLKKSAVCKITATKEDEDKCILAAVQQAA